MDTRAGNPQTIAVVTVPKILIAAPLYPPDVGGPAKYAKEIFEELSRRDASPGLVVWGEMEKWLPWGARHLWYFVRLILRAGRADAVLALDTWSTGVPALCAAKMLRKKFLVRIGGDLLWESYIERTGKMVRLSEFYTIPCVFTYKERLVRAATRFLVRRADILLFNTGWQRAIWQAAYGFAPARAEVLENHYAAAQQVGGLTHAKKTFVAAGRGIVYKNIPMFERAFAEVAKNFQDIKLDTKPLLPQEHVARVARSYAVAVPSVSEINSNFIIEALHHGKPFIAPRDSGMLEKLQGLGIFIDTLDQQALEGAIKELLDEHAYAAYVERIRAFAYTHSWVQITDEILDAARKA